MCIYVGSFASEWLTALRFHRSEYEDNDRNFYSTDQKKFDSLGTSETLDKIIAIRIIKKKIHRFKYCSWPIKWLQEMWNPVVSEILSFTLLRFSIHNQSFAVAGTCSSTTEAIHAFKKNSSRYAFWLKVRNYIFWVVGLPRSVFLTQ